MRIACSNFPVMTSDGQIIQVNTTLSSLQAGSMPILAQVATTMPPVSHKSEVGEAISTASDEGWTLPASASCEWRHSSVNDVTARRPGHQWKDWSDRRLQKESGRSYLTKQWRGKMWDRGQLLVLCHFEYCFIRSVWVFFAWHCLRDWIVARLILLQVIFEVPNSTSEKVNFSWPGSTLEVIFSSPESYYRISFHLA